MCVAVAGLVDARTSREALPTDTNQVTRRASIREPSLALHLARQARSTHGPRTVLRTKSQASAQTARA